MDQERLDRLIGHLEKLEELTGRKCRMTPRVPRAWGWMCPIINFAPRYNKDGHKFHSGACDGHGVIYQRSKFNDVEYDIHSQSDTEWWQSLSVGECHEYTKAVSKYFRRRNVK